ncbi:MAG: FecR domain-containing protein [Spirochaetes bacterium]|nr:FecR domain-containing protein [Spirochaetota bacterium]
MKEPARLERILKKYKLTSRLSYSVKRRILKSKRKTLAGILKKERYDSPFVSAAVYFEYLLGRFGINISPAGGARVFAAVSVFSLFVIVSSSALLFYNYRDIATVHIAGTGIKEYQKGYILIADSGIRIVRDGREISGIKPKDRLLTKDEIITGKKGVFLFQLEKKTMVRVLEESLAKVDINLKLKALRLDSGTVFCNVKELAKNEQFSVATSNAMVRVAGTLFSVKYLNRKTTVMVVEGMVRATNLQNNETVLVGPGRTAVIEGDSTIVKNSVKSEELPLGKFGNLEYIDKIMEKTETELNELNTDTSDGSDAEDKNRSEDKIKTLDDIKRKYGKLEEVQLYNGRIYKGAIISRGKNFRIVTLKGAVRIPADKVKNVRILE